MSDRKPIFDAIKRAREGAAFTAEAVRQIDELLDLLGVPRPDARRKIGPKGIALTKRWEGCELTAYPDPGTGGDPWTVGWGTTRINGKPVRRGMTITQAEADALLEQQLEGYAHEVAKAIGDAPTTQEQFDALVSFHYNTGAIGRATLTKLHKAGDYAGAANEFGKWLKAGGRTMAGLVNRRADEAALYRSGS
jgi:GH24 family phage-related lysozyme (muramidase)